MGAFDAHQVYDQNGMKRGVEKGADERFPSPHRLFAGYARSAPSPKSAAHRESVLYPLTTPEELRSNFM